MFLPFLGRPMLDTARDAGQTGSLLVRRSLVKNGPGDSGDARVWRKPCVNGRDTKPRPAPERFSKPLRAAERIASTFASAGGPRAATEALEKLLNDPADRQIK